MLLAHRDVMNLFVRHVSVLFSDVSVRSLPVASDRSAGLTIAPVDFVIAHARDI